MITKHGVNANQVFQWRRLYQDGRLGAPPVGAMKLLIPGYACCSWSQPMAVETVAVRVSTGP
jgi:transposase-like protein